MPEQNEKYVETETKKSFYCLQLWHPNYHKWLDHVEEMEHLFYIYLHSCTSQTNAFYTAV
jgi:hypothetical protein